MLWLLLYFCVDFSGLIFKKSVISILKISVKFSLEEGVVLCLVVCAGVYRASCCRLVPRWGPHSGVERVGPCVPW